MKRREVTFCQCRYFLHNWPKLCWFAFHGETCFGVVVCKLDMHRDLIRGYLAMLVVLKEYRGLGVGNAFKDSQCTQLYLKNYLIKYSKSQEKNESPKIDKSIVHTLK